MKPFLKYITSPDIDDLEKFNSVKEDFCYLIQAFFGPTSGDGEESFDFLVCSPKWLEAEAEKDKLIFGKGLIITNEFNLIYVKNMLSSLCNRVSGKNWEEIAIKLSRYGNWEFEDY